MRILLQFPEGLKKNALSEAKKLEGGGHEVYLSASPCYGACDLALEEAKAVGAEKLIHYGHSRYIKELPAGTEIEVEYREHKMDVPIENLSKLLPAIGDAKEIVLCMTVQHAHQLQDMKKALEARGLKVLTGKGCFTTYEGQVLGCDASAATSAAKGADAIVYIGTGKFHPTAIDSEKPVYSFNPFTGETTQMNEEIEKLRKRKRGALLKALESDSFGILLSTKPGQLCVDAAKWAQEELRKRGKEAHILIANEISPGALENFRSFGCYVNTACPRLAEDAELFEKPILNAVDLKLLLEQLDRAQKR